MNRRSFLKSTPLALTATAVGVPAAEAVVALPPLQPALSHCDDLVVRCLTEAVISGYEEVLRTGFSVPPVPVEISKYKPSERARVRHMLDQVSDEVWNYLWCEDQHMQAIMTLPAPRADYEENSFYLMRTRPETGARERLLARTIRINFCMPQALRW